MKLHISTRVLVADQRPMIVSCLTRTLAKAHGISVHSGCHDPDEVQRAVTRDATVDLAILDPQLYGSPSLAVQAFRSIQEHAAILLTSTHVDESLLLAVAQENVSCVSVYSDAHDVLSAARSLIVGKPILPHDVQRALADRLRQPAGMPQLLTSREHQTLKLAATGLTVSRIATSLHISHSTAKTHLRHAYEKLDAPNRSAAITTAIRLGILNLGTNQSTAPRSPASINPMVRLPIAA